MPKVLHHGVIVPVARPAPALVSVVIPCFNEEEVILETHGRLTRCLVERLPCPFEIIYVDDGSGDQTASILSALAGESPHVRVVRLSRNFGHQLAVTAGIDAAEGEVVVLIDADLQDPPEVIPDMVARWQQGADVVYGVRRGRQGESRFKRYTAAGFYRLLNHLSEIPIPLDTGDFRLMDRKVVEVLKRMPESQRFIRGMVAWAGFVQEPILYDRDARFAGESKYPLRKMLHFAVDGMSSFSTRPLRLATWIGFSAAGTAVLGIAYALVARLLTDSWVPGWAALFVAVMFIGGIQLLALGLIGEYVGRLFLEAKGRPLYVAYDVDTLGRATHHWPLRQPATDGGDSAASR